MMHKFVELLTNLLLALLAILVPIFAVMVSISARAIEEGRGKLQQNIQGIFTDIDEIRKKSAESAETAIKELKKAIRRYSWQRRKAQIQLFLLTTRAAIYYPGLLFLVSLGLLVRPLSQTAQLAHSDLWLIYASCGLAVIGAALLCGVLETVSSFASKYDPPVASDAPNLSLRLSNNTAVMVSPQGSTQQITLHLTNTSDYMAETIEVSVLFPPQFQQPQLKGARSLRLVPQVPPSRYKDFFAVFWSIDRLHGKTFVPSPPIEIQVPGEKGEYVIPARLKAAKIRVIEAELKIIVN